MNYPNQSENPARIALTRAVNQAMANGSPVYVNQPARLVSPLVSKVTAALTILNMHYGYGDVRSTVVYMDGRIEFQVQGFGMGVKLRRGHLNGDTVHALGHQRKIR